MAILVEPTELIYPVNSPMSFVLTLLSPDKNIGYKASWLPESDVDAVITPAQGDLPVKTPVQIRVDVGASATPELVGNVRITQHFAFLGPTILVPVTAVTSPNPNPLDPDPVNPGLPPTGLPPTGLPPTGLPPTGLPPTGLPPTGLPPTGLSGKIKIGPNYSFLSRRFRVKPRRLLATIGSPLQTSFELANLSPIDLVFYITVAQIAPLAPIVISPSVLELLSGQAIDIAVSQTSVTSVPKGVLAYIVIGGVVIPISYR